MKRHLVNRLPVNPRFRFRDTGKNIQCPSFRAFAYGGTGDKGSYAFPAAVFVLAVVVMLVAVMMVSVVVDMFALAVVMVSVIVAMIALAVVVMPGIVGVFAFDSYQRPGAGNAATLIPAKLKTPSGYRQLPQFRLQITAFNAEFNQRAQSHIARNTGETVEMQCFHTLSL
jgi:endonuclease/exonuclease/phosphatase (EEP) superfamily protein YafD